MVHVEQSPATPFRLAMEVGDPFAPPQGKRVRLELEPGKVERGLLKLVLSLVELIRQLMEKQAIRRIEGGGLADEEVDRLGRSLLEVETKIRELQAQFGIDDLNIELGPIGTLIDR